MQANSTTIDAAVAAAGSKATYAGAGAATGGWLLSSEAGVLIGIVIGILGLAVNFYFKRREDMRLAEEHGARMSQLFNKSSHSADRLNAAIDRVQNDGE